MFFFSICPNGNTKESAVLFPKSLSACSPVCGRSWPSHHTDESLSLRDVATECPKRHGERTMSHHVTQYTPLLYLWIKVKQWTGNDWEKDEEWLQMN